MKRDWELVRQILVRLENEPLGRHGINADSFGEEYPRDMVCYHMALMQDAGLIEAKVLKGGETYLAGTALAMTWSGHEFLDGIRNDNSWRQVKDTVKSKGLDLTFEVIKSAVKVVTEMALKGTL